MENYEHLRYLDTIIGRMDPNGLRSNPLTHNLSLINEAYYTNATKWVFKDIPIKEILEINFDNEQVWSVRESDSETISI